MGLFKKPWGDDAQQRLEVLKFKTREITKLWRAFGKIDMDRSGTITFDELLYFLDVDRTPFVEKVFHSLDVDDSGELEFLEYCEALWNYNTFGRSGLISFSFDIYDDDRSGRLAVDEFEQMMRDCFGESFRRFNQSLNLLQKVRDMARAVEGEDKGITKAEFKKFMEKNESLLMPAFQMQQNMRTKIGGEMYWERIAHRRDYLSRIGVEDATMATQIMEAEAEMKAKRGSLYQRLCKFLSGKRDEEVIQKRQIRIEDEGTKMSTCSFKGPNKLTDIVHEVREQTERLEVVNDRHQSAVRKICTRPEFGLRLDRPLKNPRNLEKMEREFAIKVEQHPKPKPKPKPNPYPHPYPYPNQNQTLIHTHQGGAEEDHEGD
mmetsp:Transcript_8199/g.23344  ORF Transcript_8199/g.23344 Transcript_8199/m.23344 type:complete len:375 (-) Transcript_8199:422-1546(-)